MANEDKLVSLEDLKAAYDTQYEIITPEWSSSTTYNAGDYCIYNGDLWRCKVDGLSGSNNAPVVGQNWADCTAMGQIKVVQENIAPRFSESSTYDVGDYVTYNNRLYRCKDAVTNAGNWSGTGDNGNWTELENGIVAQLSRLWYDVVPKWEAGKAYQVGDYVTYNRHFYRMVIQPVQPRQIWTEDDWERVYVVNELNGEISELQSIVNTHNAEIAKVVKEIYIYSGNIVDTRGKTAPASGTLDNSIHFNFVDGVYYSNPFTTNSGKTLLLYPRDESGNAIYMSQEGSETRSYLFDLNKWYLWKIVVDGLKVNVYGYTDQANFESNSPSTTLKRTLESEPAYWLFKGAGYTGGGSIDRGWTQGTYSTTYVSYVDPTTAYVYAKELDTHIAGEVSDIRQDVADMQPLVHKTAEVLYQHSGNIVDTTGKTASGSTIGGIQFIFGNDTYYTNPFTTDTGKKIIIYPKDKNGDAVYITRTNGSRITSMELYAGLLYVVTLDDLKIDAVAYGTMAQFLSDTRNESYSIHGVMDSVPEYWLFGGTGYTAGEAINRGFTQGHYNENYEAYAEPVKGLVYSKKLDDHIGGIVDLFRNEMFKPSYNLLDYSKIVWYSDGGYYGLQRDYYMPVTAGEVIVTNNTQGIYYFYDSTYTQLSSPGFSVPYRAVTVPENAVWLRVKYSVSFITEGDPVMIWAAKSETSAPYERPIFRPSTQYMPQYANGDIFNYAVPDSMTQGVMRMARYAALQAANERQSAYRLATFNKYVSRQDSNFPTIREMALDYALDFIGFQECSYPGTQIQEAMYPFQFPYGTAERKVDNPERHIPVPSVSRFEIISEKDILLEESRHCLRVTVNLPQNKHYPRVPTLSIYNYHGSLAKASRLIEIQTMLDEIANDTADFIVVMGDTNSEVDMAGHRQSWDMWEANGFRAVHHGESPTWPNTENPSSYSSMDNIFVSDHINVLGYDIILSRKYKTEAGLDISDHDLVFADLQFDFDAVLKDTWEEPRTIPV